VGGPRATSGRGYGGPAQKRGDWIERHDLLSWDALINQTKDKSFELGSFFDAKREKTQVFNYSC
jgi:hypothetical protein